MGIRFACHVCERRLNIKQELAGRRGICPVCAARIRIPLADAEKSTPVADKKPVPAPQVATPQVAARSDAAISAKEQPTSTQGSVSTPSPASSSPVSSSPVSSSPAASSPATTRDLGDSSDSVDEIFTEDSEATWYVRPPSGGQYGPATTEVLRQWIEEGRVATTALLWREGWPQWREANEALPEFASRLPDTGGGSASLTAKNSSEIATSQVAASDLHAAQSPSPSTTASGQSDLESARRSKSSRRMMTIGVLSFVALTLILALVFFAFR